MWVICKFVPSGTATSHELMYKWNQTKWLCSFEPHLWERSDKLVQAQGLWKWGMSDVPVKPPAPRVTCFLIRKESCFLALNLRIGSLLERTGFVFFAFLWRRVAWCSLSPLTSQTVHVPSNTSDYTKLTIFVFPWPSGSWPAGSPNGVISTPRPIKSQTQGSLP